MKEFVRAGLAVGLFLAGVFFGKYCGGRALCAWRLRATSLEHRYQLSTGCQVKTGGVWKKYDKTKEHKE